MKKSRSLTIFGLALFLCGVLATALLYEVYFPQIAHIKGSGPEDPFEAWSEASYIIWAYNSTYYACRNTSTNMVDGLDTNLTQVIQDAVDEINTDGGLIFLREVEKPDDVTASDKVRFIESYEGAWKVWKGDTRVNSPVGVGGTHTHTNNTAEQTVLQINLTEAIILYNVWVDLDNMTQACYVRCYSKIDGSNFQIISAMTLHITASIDLKGLTLKQLVIDTDFKITLQSDSAEADSRTVTYRYFKEEF